MDDGPIPRVGVGMVLGLLELLDDAKGRADIFKLAGELAMELDDIGPVIEAAKLLGLVETGRGDIILTPFGAKLLEADTNLRKNLLAERLKEIKTFREVLKLLKSKRNRPVHRRQVVEILKKDMSDEEAEGMFQAIVDWGRFAELLDYDGHEELLFISAG